MTIVLFYYFFMKLLDILYLFRNFVAILLKQKDYGLLQS